MNRNKLRKINISRKIIINNVPSKKMFYNNNNLQKLILSKKIQKILVNYVPPKIIRVCNVNIDRLDESKLCYAQFKLLSVLPPHIDLRPDLNNLF